MSRVILVVAATPGAPGRRRSRDARLRRRPGRGGRANRGRARGATRPQAVLNVGIAGGADASTRPSFVIGSEAVYCDADDPRWIELRTPADPGLRRGGARALPGRARRADRRPPRASAARAAARSRRWRATPCCAPPRSPACRRSRCACSRTRSASRTAAAGASTRRRRSSRRRCRGWSRELVACLSCPRRCRPTSGRSGSSSPRRSAPTARASGARCRSGLPLAVADQLSVRQSAETQMLVYWAATPLFVARLRLGVRARCTASARHRVAVGVADPRLPAVPGAARGVHPAGARVVRVHRARGAGGDGRAARVPRRARARPAASVSPTTSTRSGRSRRSSSSSAWPATR